MNLAKGAKFGERFGSPPCPMGNVDLRRKTRVTTNHQTPDWLEAAYKQSPIHDDILAAHLSKPFHWKARSSVAKSARYSLIFGEATLNALSQLTSIRGKKIADLGCGDGEMSALFSRGGAVVYSVDVDLQALRRAGELFQIQAPGPCFLINAQVEALPMATESIDVTFSRSTLQYMDISRVLAEIRRTLRQGGVAIFNENLPNNPFVQLYRSLRFIRAKLTGNTGYINTIREYFSTKDLKLLQRDFTVSVKYYHLLRPITIFPLRITRKYECLLWLDKSLASLDSYLLQRMPRLQKYAWQISIVAIKKGK